VQFRDAQGQPTTPPRSLDVTVEASSPDGPPQRQRSFVYDSFTASAASAPASGGVGVATLTVSAPGVRGDSARVVTVAPAAPRMEPTPPPSAVTPPAPPDAGSLDERAYRLGAEAAGLARSDPANTELLIADQYTRVLDLTADETVHPRLTDAFRRGYRSQGGP
jgi:predicted secreted protein